MQFNVVVSSSPGFGGRGGIFGRKKSIFFYLENIKKNENGVVLLTRKKRRRRRRDSSIKSSKFFFHFPLLCVEGRSGVTLAVKSEPEKAINQILSSPLS